MLKIAKIYSKYLRFSSMLKNSFNLKWIKGIFDMKKIALILLILFILVAGCSSQEPKSVCGNRIADAGEQCDGTGCSGNQICTNNCKCESLSPPALPE